MPFVDYPDFANSDPEAERRYLLAKHDDPFPEIAHALLNSADIFDYVRMTGMLYPFHRDKVKSASYEAAIRGRCIWWDEDEQRQEKLLVEQNQEQFVLKANSIAFVQAAPSFRLPDYIALRFNLKIEHVHRGILLGTGPLVDPGFVGQLFIKLRNITTNDYVFECGQGLIWIEFTKTSCLPGGDHGRPNDLGLARYGEYIPFPDRKKNLEPEYYLFQASPHKPIRSSIPEVGRESRDQATKAAQESARSAREADKARRELTKGRQFVFTVIGIGAFVLLLTLAGVTYQTWSLIQDTWKVVDEVRAALKQNAEGIHDLQRRAETVEQKADLLEKRLPKEKSSRQGHTESLATQKQSSSAPTNTVGGDKK